MIEKFSKKPVYIENEGIKYRTEPNGKTFKLFKKIGDDNKEVAADPKSPYFWKGLGTFASEITKEEYDK
jgi:hypothetical protein